MNSISELGFSKKEEIRLSRHEKLTHEQKFAWSHQISRNIKNYRRFELRVVWSDFFGSAFF